MLFGIFFLDRWRKKIVFCVVVNHGFCKYFIVIQTDNLTKDILRRFKYSQNLFPDVKDEDEADFLSRFAFICLLSFDAYLKKQLVERLIDETLSDEAKQKKDK